MIKLYATNYLSQNLEDLKDRTPTNFQNVINKAIFERKPLKYTITQYNLFSNPFLNKNGQVFFMTTVINK